MVHLVYYEKLDDYKVDLLLANWHCKGAEVTNLSKLLASY